MTTTTISNTTTTTATTSTIVLNSKILSCLTCLISLCCFLFTATTSDTSTTTTPLVTDVQVMTPKKLVRFVRSQNSLSFRYSFNTRLSGRSLSTSCCYLRSSPAYCYSTHTYGWNVCIIYKNEQTVQSKSHSHEN
jgi:hypothetical protein